MAPRSTSLGRGCRLTCSLAALAAVITAAALLGAPADANATVPIPLDSSPVVSLADTTAPPTPDRTDEIIVVTTTADVSDADVSERTESVADALDLDISADVSRDLTARKRIVDLERPIPIEDAIALAEQLDDEPGIAAATPNRHVEATVAPADITLPDDTYISQQWDIWDGAASGTGGYSVRAPAAWPMTTGTGAIVAVLDTGITVHPDLAGQTVPGYDFISDSAGARDGSGRDPDPTDEGDWNSVSSPSCSVSDSSWHGTHVAGTIAALRGPGHGVTGVAPGAKVQPVRVLGRCGGTSLDILDAVTWASGGHVSGVADNPTPADVINLSLGGSGTCTSTDNNVFAAARARGTLVVVAAGNTSPNGADVSTSWPANCASVMAVAATSRQGQRAYYSHYGTGVEIAAPGGDYHTDSEILSTLNDGATTPTTPTWAAYQGTSMAAPHVAAVAALLRSADDSLTAAQVESILTSTAQPFPATGSRPCTTSTCGTGIVDAAAAVATLAPGAPQNVTVTPGVESLTLSWAAPSAGSGITSYTVQHSIDDSTWLGTTTIDDTRTTVIGLAPGIAYRVRVRATNGIGAGPWATSSPATPLAPTAPAAPTGLTVLPDDSALQLAWMAPSDTGGRALVGYDVQHSSDDSTWIADDTSATGTSTITNLANGTAYRVRVRAVNAIGASPWTTSVTPVTPMTLSTPTAPQGLQVTASQNSLLVGWGSPASDGGRPITSYVIERSRDDSTWTSVATTAASPYTVGGLSSGTTYVVRVAAVNALGHGPWTSRSATTTTPAAPPSSGGGGGGGSGGGGGAPPPAPAVTTPGAPVLIAAAEGDRQVTAAWRSPDDTGGAAITGYIVEVAGDDTQRTVTVTDTQAIVTGLANGSHYRLRVAALNAAGTGAWSPLTSDLTPRTTPDAPLQVHVSAGNGSLAIEWTSPTSDGGAPITGYLVEWSSAAGTQQVPATGNALTLASLTNGTRYVVRVAAVNAAGTGSWSITTSGTPTAPRVSAPTAVAATRNGGTVRVRWQRPARGIALSYIVSASINGRPWKTAAATEARSATVAASRRATIVVKVAAVDARGRGPWSAIARA